MSGNGDYIGKKTVLEALCSDCLSTECNKKLCQDYYKIASIPAADVRPVVFCGDCTRYFGKEDGGYTAGYCKRTYVSIGPFDFCSRGEKRDD